MNNDIVITRVNKMEKRSEQSFPLCEISDEAQDYTTDTFKCGICNIEKGSIDDYVVHMLEVENCVMLMEASKYLKDLFLPRFKKKIDPKKYEDTEERKAKSLFAVEIEVSNGVTRWKCRVCGLTFSREAAIANHYKLAEHQIPEGGAISTNSILKTVKMESKENTEVVDVEENHHSSINVEDQDDKLPLKSIKIQNSNPVCHICGQIFKSVSIVASHIKIVHSEKRPFVCNVKDCSLSFKTKGSLVRHLRRHTGARPFVCNQCGRAYRESGSLLRHQQSKIPCNLKPDSHLPRYGITLPFSSGLQSDSEVDCKISLKKEVSEEDDISNITSASTDLLQEPEETKAKVRKEILRNQELISVSEDTFSTKQEKKPVLKTCTKEEFGASDGEEEAVDASSLEDEEDKILRRYFMCPLCYKSYTQMTYLSSHMKTHLAELGNECCTCKKRFTSDHALTRHLLTHSSARQFECKQCGKGFKLKSHALNHLKSHSKSKTIPCPDCSSLFKSVSSRNTHMKIHTQERNYECNVCFKTFLVKASLLRHQNVHSKEQLQDSQVDRKGTSKIKSEDMDTHAFIKSDIPEEKERPLEDVNDLSEVDSEFDSFLSEKFDLYQSSLYSEQSEISFSPENYLFPNY